LAGGELVHFAAAPPPKSTVEDIIAVLSPKLGELIPATIWRELS
jgi:hypothetical protein